MGRRDARSRGRAHGGQRNTEVPLVEAVDRDDLEVFVVECTNHRLATAETFRGEVAAWINFAPDHLNWHRSVATYEAAKARLFAQQRHTDIAIGAVADPTVMRHLAAAPGTRRTFGWHDADYDVSPAGELRGPQVLFGTVGRLRRGASPRRDERAVRGRTGARVGAGRRRRRRRRAGVVQRAAAPHRARRRRRRRRWYNDSKATTPHAASTAIRAFDHVVLIAGGLNKGLDLSPMAAERHRIRAVVAIGRAAGDIEAVFAGSPVIAAGIDGRRRPAGRRGRPPRRCGPAVTRVRQLRLVPRWRVPRARRRLPAPRPAPTARSPRPLPPR